MPKGVFQRKTVPWQERLWKLIRLAGANNCWEYSLRKFRDGYGQFKRLGKNSRAHRAAWESAYGAIPPGLQVLHKCDNRACCRPDHLFLGTNQDNMDDMLAKGRKAVFPRSAHPSAKLTEQNVRDIFEMAEHADRKDIAKTFGVHRRHVDSILSGRRWKQVTPQHAQVVS